MFFRRKGYLRREYDEQLIRLLEEMKQEWLRQKQIVEKSVEPSEYVLCHLKLAEAKYFYLLKAAKQRQVKILK